MGKKRIVIEPGKEGGAYWRDLWNHRELLYYLTLRDILIRYKQTLLGIAWSAFRPLLTIMVFTVVFGKIAHLPNNGVPYAVMVCCAILPWQFFSNALSDASNSLVNNSEILSKVYFPRMIFPISATSISLVDFVISFGILCLLMLFYAFVPAWTILILPLFLAVAFITALGAGFFIASLNVRFRDFKFIIPFLLQLGLFISPIGFSSSVVPEKWKLIYYLNPMAGVIDGFRWAILGGETKLFMPGMCMSVGISFLVLFLGISFFRKVEREFVDII
ncbi:MAG TPA: ABC transporter permease [Bacteroidia bacterium]|jgi:lipopolysaccharide transport system permease protein|nr:ABC transporter permease [Bacteroidia bacterium]